MRDRRKVRLLGFVSSQVVQPAGAPPSVEIDLTDGTGTITVVWLGRERITGLGPGSRIAVEGFAALRGHSRVMYNPRYEILGVPGEEER
ncbi:OB-fold nucleic acid binding domain-containing protein [Brachybacterium sp. EF45031]|nr:OB-fold nucleic acid binding domain-containing protein [Brachybacterium sillae]